MEHSSDLRSTGLRSCKDRSYILGEEEGARGDSSEASGQESTVWIYPKDKVAMLIGNDNNREEVEEPSKTKKAADRPDPKEHMRDDCVHGLKWEVRLLSVMAEDT